MSDAQTTEPKLARAPLFESFNSYSLKREAINVGNPALIWHRAYWRPDGVDESRWHTLVNSYIVDTASIFRDFCGHHRGKFDSHGAVIKFSSKNNPGTLSQGGDNSYRDLSSSFISARFNGLKVNLVFEKFDEFWSIKLIIDYSRYTEGMALPKGFSRTAKWLIAAEQLIVDGLSDEVAESKDKKNAAVEEISRGISNELVDIVDILFPSLSKSDKRHSIISLDDLFANFVGFSLGFSSGKSPSRLLHKKATNVSENINPQGIINRDDNLFQLIDALWPLTKRLNPKFAFEESGSISKLNRRNNSNDESRREFTISTIDNGRAIYITSLGGNRSTDGKAYYPLSYILLCPHKATWQIGRFIDRIHTLGLFRLAALKDYQLVEDSSQSIRNLLNRVYVRDDIENISRDFDDLCTKPNNGLHDRVERSKYYMSLFREGLRSVKFGRIEGYQSYPEFVSQKFSGRFETIDNVSKSLEFLGQQIALHVNQANNDSIRDLLEFADQLSVIPIAYYSHHVFEFANDFLLSLFGQQINISWTIFWVAFSLYYAGHVWVYKRFLSGRRKHRFRFKANAASNVERKPFQ